MGGMAFLLNVKMTAEGLEPRPGKRSLIDKLIGRRPMVSPTRSGTGNGSLFEVDATALKGLEKDLESWLTAKLPAPNDATRVFLDTYLSGSRLPVRYFVRGEGDAGPENAKWYFQMSFSGCAGMAEVSSALASHWAELWYEAEPVSVDARLSQIGVIADGIQRYDEGKFLPFAEVGYGLYWPNLDIDRDEKFEFDGSMTSELMDEAAYEDFLAFANEHEAAMSDGRCHCQICDDECSVIPGPA